jgi:Flp pilus assembly protein TadG
MRPLHFLHAACWRFRQRRAGTTSVEFAMVASILAVCFISAYDLGNILQQHIRLREGVRAGGIFAQTYPDDSSGIQSAVTAALSGWSNVTVTTPTVTCDCWNTTANTATARVACTDSSITNCTNTVRRFVTITASRPFSAMFLPGLGNSTSATHVVRYQ